MLNIKQHCDEEFISNYFINSRRRSKKVVLKVVFVSKKDVPLLRISLSCFEYGYPGQQHRVCSKSTTMLLTRRIDHNNTNLTTICMTSVLILKLTTILHAILACRIACTYSSTICEFCNNCLWVRWKSRKSVYHKEFMKVSSGIACAIKCVDYAHKIILIVLLLAELGTNSTFDIILCNVRNVYTPYSVYNHS